MTGIRQKLLLLSQLLAAALLALAGATAARAQTVTEYPIPSGVGPQAIAAGPDGALWFTAEGCNNCGANSTPGMIGRITTAGAITLYPVPSGNIFLYSIAPGPDGALWYTDYYGNAVGRITTGGVFSQFPVNGVAPPQAITAGSDGALWFTESSSFAYIGRITTSGTVTQYNYGIEYGIAPSIVSGPDGALWFPANDDFVSTGNEFFDGFINSITTGGSRSSYSTSNSVNTSTNLPGAIASGPDGALWFTTSNSINRITTAGTVTNSFPVTAAPGPFGIASGGIITGPDGALWFVSGSNIGRITTAGVVSYFPTVSNGAPQSLAGGPDSAIWFTDRGTNSIGRLAILTGTTTLTVSEAGSGAGQVTSNPSGISCNQGSGQCSASFATGSLVTLSATPGNGSFFAGWSGGGCSGTGSCTVTLSAATNVTATFSAVPDVTLTVALSGSGTGQVTSNPAGINCRATSNQCSNGFNVGSQVTLTASASAGSSFSGWSGGGCSGTGGCTVTMNQAATVTATFAQLPSYMLSVAPAGNGTGTVTSTPTGINCGATCAASFFQGTQVTLSGAAAQGSTFTGWSGGVCAGANPCTVTMSANTNVTATFVQNSSSGIQLVAAVLPLSRSVQVGAAATAFATVIDAGPGDAQACSIAPATSIPASFVYQTTDPTTNALIGNPNTPANIAQGGGQSFVIGFTPSAAFSPTNVLLNFACANASAAPQNTGIDTLNLSASTSAVPDIVALAASGDPGYVDIPGATGTGDFAVATVNLGAAATITVAGNTGSANLPVTILVCQTNPASGACLATPALSTTASIAANATPTFGFFVTGSASIPDAPGVNRVFATFTDAGGTLRGETSVAVRTQ